VTSKKDDLEHNLAACSDALGSTSKFFGGNMQVKTNSAPQYGASSHPGLTRRQLVNGAAIAIGGIVASSTLLAKTLQQPGQEKPGSSATSMRTSLHDEIVLKTSPQRIYELLLSSKQFAALTGAPAEIEPTAGGTFTTFGKLIEGRNIELVPHQRIVQAWRPASWEPGVYSIVRFELKPRNSETTLVLDHTGFPEGDLKHLQWGWEKHYWEPLKKSFS
jgi:activator of HSP90 ATPase